MLTLEIALFREEFYSLTFSSRLARKFRFRFPGFRFGCGSAALRSFTAIPLKASSPLLSVPIRHPWFSVSNSCGLASHFHQAFNRFWASSQP
jgi:hypothetical protein